MLCSDPPKFWGIHILDNVKKNYPQFSNTALILTLYNLDFETLSEFLLKIRVRVSSKLGILQPGLYAFSHDRIL